MRLISTAEQFWWTHLNVTDHFSTRTASECEWVVPEDEYLWAEPACSSDRLGSVPQCGVGSASQRLRTSCRLCTELPPGSGCTSSEDTFKVSKITVFFNKTNRWTNFPKFIFVKKLYIFRAVPLSIIRSFPLYFRHWYTSCKFDDSFQARPGWNTILVVLESCHQTCMTYTSAECTVENSWWWREELPKTCRVSWQK